MEAENYLELAKENFENALYDEAYSILTGIIPGNDTDLEILLMLGKISYKRQNFGEAINFFNKALEINPQNEEAQGMLVLVNQIIKLTRNFYFENPYTDDGLYE